MPARLTPDRFWSNAVRAPSGCLEWIGNKHRDGYGQLNYQRRYWLAHRLAWTLTFGEIPNGLCVCHKCDNPCCIDPSHLFLGSHTENMRDMRDKGRRKHITYGARNGRAIINSRIAQEIRARYIRGVTRQVDIARDYGISQVMVSAIVRNKNWI